VHLVEMDAEGDCSVARIPLTPERDLRRVEGTLSEIQENPAPDKNAQDYVWVTLENDGPVVDAMSRIRETYPNALHVEHPYRREEGRLEGLAEEVEAADIEEVFGQFVTHATGREKLSDEHADILDDALGRLDGEAPQA
jgi:exonuclease SbcD